MSVVSIGLVVVGSSRIDSEAGEGQICSEFAESDTTRDWIVGVITVVITAGEIVIVAFFSVSFGILHFALQKTRALGCFDELVQS